MLPHALPELAWLYLFLSWSLLTLTFIAPKTWLLLGRWWPESLTLRSAEWAWRLIFLMFLGFWFDSLTLNQPHNAYGSTAFYLAFVTLQAVLTLPALVYYLAVTNRLK